MSVMEIVLLVLGAAVFIVSFFVPETGKQSKVSEKIDDAAINELVNTKVSEAQGRIDDIVEESIRYAMEKSERSMDRLSNEKMMAVNEYSDAVLSQIDKNHKEVLFLYDMLSDKSVDLKNTVREAVQVQKETKEIKEIVEARVEDDLQEFLEGIADRAEKIDPAAYEAVTASPAEAVVDDTASVAGANDIVFDTLEAVAQNSARVDLDIANASVAAEAPKVQHVTAPPKKKAAPKRKPKVDVRAADMDITFDADASSGKNKNEKILALHKQGKSNVEIARELGLGMGEVKLVLDLFKGKK